MPGPSLLSEIRHKVCSRWHGHILYSQKESTESFTINTLLSVGIHRCTLSHWWSSLLLLVCWAFYHESVLDLVNCFFWHILSSSSFLYFKNLLNYRKMWKFLTRWCISRYCCLAVLIQPQRCAENKNNKQWPRDIKGQALWLKERADIFWMIFSPLLL